MFEISQIQAKVADAHREAARADLAAHVPARVTLRSRTLGTVRWVGARRPRLQRSIRRPAVRVTTPMAPAESGLHAGSAVTP